MLFQQTFLVGNGSVSDGGICVIPCSISSSASTNNYQPTPLTLSLIHIWQEPVQKLQLNRAYQSTMPIGSSIKPIAVYGPAFDWGYSPGTPVLNLPINICLLYTSRCV